MITLLENKDKDRGFIKIWRPISLINVDVKIASKPISRRLESILPELIHPNQNGFIKSTSILDAARMIDDILEFAKVTECCGILLWGAVFKFIIYFTFARFFRDMFFYL